MFELRITGINEMPRMVPDAPVRFTLTLVPNDPASGVSGSLIVPVDDVAKHKVGEVLKFKA